MLVLPIPVPIFVPVPMHLYCQKVPVPFSMPIPVSAPPRTDTSPAPGCHRPSPDPVPCFLALSWDSWFQVPVPMFLPTTLESTDKIVETIEELKVKIPSNPLEADILAMAEMIAEAEELDKASSDLCGMSCVVAMGEPMRHDSVSAWRAESGDLVPGGMGDSWGPPLKTWTSLLPRSCEQPECRGASRRLRPVWAGSRRCLGHGREDGQCLG